MMRIFQLTQYPVVNNDHIIPGLVGMCQKVHFWEPILTPSSSNNEVCATLIINAPFYGEQESWGFVSFSKIHK